MQNAVFLASKKEESRDFWQNLHSAQVLHSHLTSGCPSGGTRSDWVWKLNPGSVREGSAV